MSQKGEGAKEPIARGELVREYCVPRATSCGVIQEESFYSPAMLPRA